MNGRTLFLIGGVALLVLAGVYTMRVWQENRSAQTPESARHTVTPPNGSTMRIANPSGPIVVLGASYAGGWKIDRIAGTEVINKGVSGQASFEVLERFERDVAAVKPRAVILWGFINDIFRAGADASPAIQRARDSYIRMIALARDNGIEPILATEVTIRQPPSWMNTVASFVGRLRGKESHQARINRHVIETNRWLVDLARRDGLLLLDFQSTLAERSGMRRAEFTQADGSHITAAAYEALTTYARPILEAHLARSAS
jgi:hypothetical protein